MKRSIFISGFLALAFAFAPVGEVNGQLFTFGHGDIGIGFEDEQMQFEPHWHLDAGSVVDGAPLAAEEEFAPVDLIAQTSATRTSPTGLNNVLGVDDGTLIYAMGSSTYQPNLGIAAEELNPMDWTANDITMTLTDWTLPSETAEFALYTTNLAGTMVIDRIFSTFAPGSTGSNNALALTPGDHAHFHWGFTELGTYSFEFTWTGTHDTHGFISTTENFTVQVVPEPSALALIGVAGAGVLLLRRRRSQS